MQHRFVIIILQYLVLLSYSTKVWKHLHKFLSEKNLTAAFFCNTCAHSPGLPCWRSQSCSHRWSPRKAWFLSASLAPCGTAHSRSWHAHTKWYSKWDSIITLPTRTQSVHLNEIPSSHWWHTKWSSTRDTVLQLLTHTKWSSTRDTVLQLLTHTHNLIINTRYCSSTLDTHTQSDHQHEILSFNSWHTHTKWSSTRDTVLQLLTHTHTQSDHQHEILSFNSWHIHTKWSSTRDTVLQLLTHTQSDHQNEIPSSHSSHTHNLIINTRYCPSTLDTHTIWSSKWDIVITSSKWDIVITLPIHTIWWSKWDIIITHLHGWFRSVQCRM